MDADERCPAGQSSLPVDDDSQTVVDCIFRLRTEAVAVSLVGNFNRWSKTLHQMVKVGHDRWETFLPLQPGCYQYAYLVLEKVEGSGGTKPILQASLINEKSVLVVPRPTPSHEFRASLPCEPYN